MLIALNAFSCALCPIVSLFSFALTRYKRCSPNEVLVVFGQTGAKGPAKIVHGGGTVVWPIIQGESTF